MQWIGKGAEEFNFSVEERKNYLNLACVILYKARSMRPRPHLDDKIITAWNGACLYLKVVKGLLDLYEVDLDERWLKAEELCDIQDELFWGQRYFVIISL